MLKCVLPAVPVVTKNNTKLTKNMNEILQVSVSRKRGVFLSSFLGSRFFLILWHKSYNDFL